MCLIAYLIYETSHVRKQVSHLFLWALVVYHDGRLFTIISAVLFPLVNTPNVIEWGIVLG